MSTCRILGMLPFAAVLCTLPAFADDFAEESYRIAEAQRLDSIARQLDLNYQMIWQSGFADGVWRYPAPRPIEHPIGYESRQTGPNRWIYRPIYAGEPRGPAIPATAPMPRQDPARAVQRPGPSELTNEPEGRGNGGARGIREF